MAADSTFILEFRNDTDTFILSETLLKLAIIWMYRQSKGRPYAEDMATYEREKEKLIAQDGGSKIITVGKVRMTGDFDIAYPISLGV